MLAIVLALLTTPEPYLLPASDIVWERRPTGSEVSQVLPHTTARPWVGSFKLYCTINGGGWLTDCFVPNPRDRAPVEEWRVKIARYFKAAPMTRSGKPPAGRVVAIPISFRAADD